MFPGVFTAAGGGACGRWWCEQQPTVAPATGRDNNWLVAAGAQHAAERLQCAWPNCNVVVWDQCVFRDSTGAGAQALADSVHTTARYA
jgi:hypothetical protein